MRFLAVTLAIAMMSIMTPWKAASQEAAYKFDIGVALGASGYLGDANTANLMSHPGFAGGASFRYLINTRWAIKGMFTTAGLSGNSADMENVYPGGQTYKFTSTVYDIGARAEFNFFNYGIGESYRKLRRWTPYLSLGAGVTIASAEGTYVAMNIPMGVGLRYKVTPRINLGLEWSMTKVFGDNVDGPVLDDLYDIKSSFLKNTDWYSLIMFSISYEFGERCKNCFYVD